MMKTYYYHDLVHDDFANTNIKTIELPVNYKYTSKNIFYRFSETIIRWFVYPIIFSILKIGYLSSVKNRKVLKKAKKQGYFIYGNHTNYMLDAYDPSFISFPRRAHIIVNPDAVSIKGIGTLVKMLGAIPIPTSIKGMKNYRNAIDEIINHKHVIAIYPEAHIWPYYTDVRPFGTESFHYAVDLNVPSFTYTSIYKKRKLIKKPRVETFIDGPFYPDMTISKPDRVKKLRNEIYEAMKKRVDENPKYNYCNYIYVDDPKLSNRKQV